MFQSTIYYVLKKYLQYRITKDLSQSGRPLKLSKKNLNNIVKSVNNQCGLSQRKMARRFKVDFDQSWKTNIDCYKKTFKSSKNGVVNNNKFEYGKTVVSCTKNY